MRIGVIGTGDMGLVLSRLALSRGHEVMTADHLGVRELEDAVTEPKRALGRLEATIRFGHVVVLAIPLHAVEWLDPTLFHGKVVLDSTNYCPEADGRLSELAASEEPTSGMVQRILSGAAVVKAFNGIRHEDIERDAMPPGKPGRRALPMAGDDPAAKRIASRLVSQFGFDPVDCGSIEDSWRLEKGTPAFCNRLDVVGLIEAVASAPRRGTLSRTNLSNQCDARTGFAFQQPKLQSSTEPLHISGARSAGSREAARTTSTI